MSGHELIHLAVPARSRKCSDTSNTPTEKWSALRLPFVFHVIPLSWCKPEMTNSTGELRGGPTGGES